VIAMSLMRSTQLFASGQALAYSARSQISWITVRLRLGKGRALPCGADRRLHGASRILPATEMRWVAVDGDEHERIRSKAARSLPRCPKTATRGPATLLASFVRELVHTLMRQRQETGCIARAHLQCSGSQDPDGASSRSGCTSVFFIGLLAKTRVSPNRPCRSSRQLHVVHNGGLAGIVRIADGRVMCLGR
jgi:hypothetical protein